MRGPSSRSDITSVALLDILDVFLGVHWKRVKLSVIEHMDGAAASRRELAPDATGARHEVNRVERKHGDVWSRREKYGDAKGEAIDLKPCDDGCREAGRALTIDLRVGLCVAVETRERSAYSRLSDRQGVVEGHAIRTTVSCNAKDKKVEVVKVRQAKVLGTGAPAKPLLVRLGALSLAQFASLIHQDEGADCWNRHHHEQNNASDFDENLVYETLCELAFEWQVWAMRAAVRRHAVHLHLERIDVCMREVV